VSDDRLDAPALREEGQRLASAFGCDGHDRHPLTLFVRQAMARRLHRLPLTSVTAVTVGKSRSTRSIG
jgi:hypothetical protein